MMTTTTLTSLHLQALQAAFGERLQHGVSLARFTAARLGGAAEAFVELETVEELSTAAGLAWELGFSFTLLGGGSNVLVGERGVSGLVALNRARRLRFDEQTDPPQVWVESGANFGVLARQCAQRGLAGLEWAASIPGTIGGAVVGNAGAHGADLAGNLLLAEILQRPDGMETATGANIHPARQAWLPERLEYAYRSSVIKRQPGRQVVLAAVLRLAHSTPPDVQALMDQYAAHRKRTQPPGASLGSMFKNPTGDYAGRLVEAAGLKGLTIGGAQISPVHANFFINLGDASAADFYTLLRTAQDAVAEKFGVQLEPEIQLLGEW